MDGAFVLVDQAQRLFDVSRLEHHIAAPLENPAGKVPHRLLILDQQDGFQGRVGAWRPRRGHSLRVGRSPGQEDREGAPLPGCALGPHVPFALLDDTVDRREAQAGARARLLGREKGLEKAAERLLVHAGAGVPHRQLDEGPRAHVVGVALRLRPLDLRVLGLDGESAAARQGVAGVDHQVEEHLFDLAGVGLDLPEARIQIHLEPDALSDQPVEQALGRGDGGVQVDHLRLQYLPARKREELTGELGGAIGSLDDLLE